MTNATVSRLGAVNANDSNYLMQTLYFLKCSVVRLWNHLKELP